MPHGGTLNGAAFRIDMNLSEITALSVSEGAAARSDRDGAHG